MYPQLPAVVVNTPEIEVNIKESLHLHLTHVYHEISTPSFSNHNFAYLCFLNSYYVHSQSCPAWRQTRAYKCL